MTLLQSRLYTASTCWDPAALAGHLGRGKKRSLDWTERSLLIYHTVSFSNEVSVGVFWCITLFCYMTSAKPEQSDTMTRKCHESLLKSIYAQVLMTVQDPFLN